MMSLEEQSIEFLNECFKIIGFDLIPNDEEDKLTDMENLGEK